MLEISVSLRGLFLATWNAFIRCRHVTVRDLCSSWHRWVHDVIADRTSVCLSFLERAAPKYPELLTCSRSSPSMELSVCRARWRWLGACSCHPVGAVCQSVCHVLQSSLAACYRVIVIWKAHDIPLLEKESMWLWRVSREMLSKSGERANAHCCFAAGCSTVLHSLTSFTELRWPKQNIRTSSMPNFRGTCPPPTYPIPSCLTLSKVDGGNPSASLFFQGATLQDLLSCTPVWSPVSISSAVMFRQSRTTFRHGFAWVSVVLALLAVSLVRKGLH